MNKIDLFKERFLEAYHEDPSKDDIRYYLEMSVEDKADYLQWLVTEANYNNTIREW